MTGFEAVLVAAVVLLLPTVVFQRRTLVRERIEAANRLAVAKDQTRQVVSVARTTRETVRDREAERDAARARVAELESVLAEREARLAALEAPAPAETITEEQRRTLLQSRCAHCGGVHARACPRVKRLRLRPDGSTVIEVEFWPSGEWDESGVTWIEELPPVSEEVGAED